MKPGTLSLAISLLLCVAVVAPLPVNAQETTNSSAEEPSTPVEAQPEKKSKKNHRKAKSKETPPEAAQEPEQPLGEQAREAYEQGLEMFKIAQIQAEKGNLNGQRNLLKESIRKFNAALAADPAMIEAQSNIGFAYLTLKQYREAIKAFQKALVMNPNHLNTLNGLATTYALDKNIDESVKTFEKLTTLDPGNSQYFFNFGSVLQKVGRVDEAKDAYLEAIRLEPRDQRSLFNLATLYENLGQLRDAKPYYEQAKSAAIETPIGLEAIRRLEAIDKVLKESSMNPEAENLHAMDSQEAKE